MKRIILVVMGLIAFIPVAAGATVQTENIQYTGDGITMHGYLAYDSGTTGKRPGVLVIHEWWGHNEYVRKRAQMLAALGYTAFAVDMYGNGTTTDHPSDAGKFSSAVMSNLDGAKARFLAAMNVLTAHPTVDPTRTAAIGYCFGGGVVLHMARMGVDIDGVASFHGSLRSSIQAPPGAVTAEVLVLHGADDPFVPQEDVEAFKSEMETAKASYTFIAYPDTVHSFTNPAADSFGQGFNLPLRYNPEADQASWTALQDFFTRIFAQ